MNDQPAPRQPAAQLPNSGSPVRGLLGAYQGVLDAVDDLPAVPLVLWTRTDRGLPARFRYLPRPSWFLRLMMVRHMDVRLGLFARRYSARAAVGSLTEREQRDRAAVEEFRQSLPPVRPVLHAALAVIAVLIVARPLASVLRWLIPRAAPTGRFAVSRDVFDQLAEGLSTDTASAAKAINALFSGGPQRTAATMFILALAAYLVLRPFVPAFRLKRMLFNLAPDRDRPLPSATSRWSVSQATGVYEQERRACAALGVRTLHEFPFDLAVPAVVMLIPLVMAASSFDEAAAASTATSDRWLVTVMGTLVLIAALTRLGWLYRTWRQRLGPPAPHLPYEVGIGGLSVAKLERPVGVRILMSLLLFLFWAATEAVPEHTVPWGLALALVTALVCGTPISFGWWKRINRELRSLDPPPTRPRSAARRVVTRVLAVAGAITVLPAFLATCRRIRRAQARTGLPQTLRFGWLLIPGLLLHPILVAYLQHELNKIWTTIGRPLDQAPATPAAPNTDYSHYPPWLRPTGPQPQPDLPDRRRPVAHPNLAAGLRSGMAPPPATTVERRTPPDPADDGDVRDVDRRVMFRDFRVLPEVGHSR